MSKRTRERQLAKLAARRQAERDAVLHRRQRIMTTIGIVAATVLVVAGGILLFGGKGSTTQASATPSVTATPSATPSGKPGTRTGTVTPTPAPTTVACGASAPPGAGKPKPQFAGPPPMKIDLKKTYTATIETSCGTIVIQLDAITAPKTVNSFVFLAEHGYFDGQYIHRLDSTIDVIQGGDPTGTGSGGPGYSIPDELNGKESYGPGVLAMANAGPNTGGSQFFLISGKNGHNLDANPNYTIFGHVIKGLDVAKRIQQLPIQDPNPSAGIAGQRPTQAIYIDKVTITAK
jgi:cyclophilin family peptidyl-prolyl cis-trans isomerase